MGALVQNGTTTTAAAAAAAVIVVEGHDILEAARGEQLAREPENGPPERQRNDPGVKVPVGALLLDAVRQSSVDVELLSPVVLETRGSVVVWGPECVQREMRTGSAGGRLFVGDGEENTSSRMTIISKKRGHSM